MSCLAALGHHKAILSEILDIEALRGRELRIHSLGKLRSFVMSLLWGGRIAAAVMAATRFAQPHPWVVVATKRALENAGVNLSGAILNESNPKSAPRGLGHSAYSCAYKACCSSTRQVRDTGSGDYVVVQCAGLHHPTLDTEAQSFLYLRCHATILIG